MEKTNRIEWINAVRGLGIISVIAFHTGFLPFIRISDPLIVSWMLPVFVFTGGWLVTNTPLTLRHLISITRRLLMPFFVSGIVSFIGWMVLRVVYPQHILEQPIGRELTKWLTGRNAYFNSPLWFIPTYFFASVIMRSMAGWWSRMRVVNRSLLSLCFVLAGFLLSNPFHYPIFSYDLIVLFVGMMMMGSIASTVSIPKSTLRLPFDVLMILLFIVFSLSNGYIDMFQRQFGNKFLYIMSAALGSYGISRLLIYAVRYQNKIVQGVTSLGRYSMDLMAWHWPIL
ncbi:MAG: acyltransferase family protein [Candidatus Gottesmanbacteria bacterium]|nr:acyltransferase family protein [Candidatus Gottesmanbacteria bacterium]